MTDTILYKDRLDEMLQEVTEELRSLGVNDPDVAENWIATNIADDSDDADPNLHADTLEEYEERASVLAVLETRYNNIRRALTKIDAGTFGTCEISGEPIEEARLAANPAARTCVAHMDEEVSLPQ